MALTRGAEYFIFLFLPYTFIANTVPHVYDRIVTYIKPRKEELFVCL